METQLIVLALLGAVACSNNVKGNTDDGDPDQQGGDPAGGDPHQGGDPAGGDNVSGGDDVTSQGPVIAGCEIFPANHIFNTRIDDAVKYPTHAHSEDFKDLIGRDTHLHADFAAAATNYGIPYNIVSGNSITWTHVIIDNAGPGDDDGDESDCAVSTDATHAIMRPCTGTKETNAVFPIPANPSVEGGTISTDPNDSGGDAHMPLLDKDACKLWEVGQTRHASDGWHSAWDAAWDLSSNDLRPADWTSADAAGFPIMPLLVKADEAATGTIKHAFRYTIDTTKIRTTYVWPARHKTTNGENLDNYPPMGQLFRLKAGTPMPAGASTRAQAVITALKQYGMYLSDGGSDWFMTGTSDDGWDGDTIDAIQTLTVDDFEAVDLTGLASKAGFDPDSGAVP